MLRIFVAVVVAVYLSITFASAEDLMKNVTVYKAKTVPHVTIYDENHRPYVEGQLTNPLATPKQRAHTSQLWDRHMMNGTLAQVSRSVGMCKRVRDILSRSLRVELGLAISELGALNYSLNKAQVGIDAKFDAFIALGIPSVCLLITRNSQQDPNDPSSDFEEEVELVLRTGTADYVLDNSEGEQTIAAWSDLVSWGTAKFYRSAGTSHETMYRITNNF